MSLSRPGLLDQADLMPSPHDHSCTVPVLVTLLCFVILVKVAHLYFNVLVRVIYLHCTVLVRVKYMCCTVLEKAIHL